jgi:hypothetical protein
MGLHPKITGQKYSSMVQPEVTLDKQGAGGVPRYNKDKVL